MSGIIALFAGCSVPNAPDTSDRFARLGKSRVEQLIQNHKLRLNSEYDSRINRLRKEIALEDLTFENSSSKTKTIPSSVGKIQSKSYISLNNFSSENSKGKYLFDDIKLTLDSKFYADLMQGDEERDLDLFDVSAEDNWFLNYLNPPQDNGFFSDLIFRFYRNLEDRIYRELSQPINDFNIVSEFYRILTKLKKYNLSKYDLPVYDRDLLELESKRLMRSLLKFSQGAGKDAFRDFLERHNLEEISQITAVEINEHDWFEYFKVRRVGVKFKFKSSGGSPGVNPELYITFAYGRFIRLTSKWRPTNQSFENYLKVNFSNNLALNVSSETIYKKRFLLKSVTGGLTYVFDSNSQLSFAFNYFDDYEQKSISQGSIMFSIAF